MDRIMALRESVMQAGLDTDYGAYGRRHVDAFAESVEHTGWLDELRRINLQGCDGVSDEGQQALADHADCRVEF